MGILFLISADLCSLLEAASDVVEPDEDAVSTISSSFAFTKPDPDQDGLGKSELKDILVSRKHN